MFKMKFSDIHLQCCNGVEGIAEPGFCSSLFGISGPCKALSSIALAWFVSGSSSSCSVSNPNKEDPETKTKFTMKENSERKAKYLKSQMNNQETTEPTP